MTNVAQGLQQADPNEAVNSEAGFAAALAGKGVEPDAADEAASDTSIASGLETVEPGPARDPATGKFVPKADTSQQQQDTSTESDTQTLQVTSDDPAVQQYLSKYGGDPEKALRAAVEAQSLIGRRDSEKDELREQLAKLTGAVETLQQQAAQPQQQQPQVFLSDEAVEEKAASLIGSQGFQAAATSAANESLQGDARTYDSIIEQWALESPIAAQRFDLDFQLWKREQAAPKTQAAPQSDPWIEEKKAEQGITDTITVLAKELGPRWQAVAPKMLDALETIPEEVAAMIASDRAETRMAGARIVADRATVLAGATTPEALTTDPELPESVKRKLSGSSVATSGLRPATPTPETPQSREDVIAQFKQDILGATDTSVASGLTFGAPAPGR